MRTQLLNFLSLPATILLGCASPAKMEYRPVQSPDPTLRIIRMFQNSQVGSSRTGSSVGFFFDPTHTVKDGINFRTTTELISFLSATKKEQPFDALVILLLDGPMPMYSTSDIQLRNEAITACSAIGIRVLVQKIGGNDQRYFLAIPGTPRPNP